MAGSGRAVKLARVTENLVGAGEARHMDGKVDVEITKEGDIAVATFKSGCISDPEGIAAADKQVRKFIDDNRPTKLIFDFAEVKFFSSQVLGLLLSVRAKLQACKGEVVISAINPQLHRVFKITNLDKIFRFFPDKEGAIRMARSNETS